MAGISLSEILELSVEERIQLAEDIWDSIAFFPEALPLTEAQKRELDRRLENLQRNPDENVSWSVIRERMIGSNEQ